MGAVEKALKVQSIYDVARDVVRLHGSDVQKATKALARRVRADTALYRELLDGMVEEACYSAIREALAAQRLKVWTAPNYDAGGKGERVKALADGNALMFFPLPGGKLLAHATRAEVEEAAEFYGVRAKDMGTKARWLQLVAEKMEGNKPVAKCLTESQLAKLQERATNG